MTVFYFILAAITLIVVGVSIVLAIGAPKESNSEVTRGSFITTAVIVGLVFAGVSIWFAATTVSPRSVGIQTAFGKYQDTLPAGFHWTAPWSSVEEFPTTVQFLELKNGEDNAGAVPVSYSGGGDGSVDTTVRWRIDEQNAEDLWRKYRTFDKVRDQLVLSQGRDSVRVVVGAYAPSDARAGENLRKITAGVNTDLGAQLADDGIKIDSVSVTNVQLSETTQRSIEKIIQAENDIKTAQANKERAKIDNETAKLREAAGSLSAGSLQRFCLDLTNAWDQGRNGPLPATWNCFGANTAGVVVGR